MRKAALAAAAVVALGVAAALAAEEPFFETHARKLFRERIGTSLVTVRALDAEGKEIRRASGFVRPKSHVVTALGVLEGAAAIEIETFDGKKLTPSGIHADIPRQIAFLTLDGARTALSEVDLQFDAGQKGARLFLMPPAGVDESPGEHHVAERRDAPLAGNVIVLTGQFPPEASGCPVLTEEGRLAGVAVRVEGRSGPAYFVVGIPTRRDLSGTSPPKSEEVLSSLAEGGEAAGFSSGIVAAWTGDYASAIELLAESAEAAGNDALRWYALGWSARASGDHTASIAAFEKALAARPIWEAGRLELAECYAEQGNLKEAFAQLGEKQPRAADDNVRWNALGDIFQSASDYEGAVISYQRSLEAAPGDHAVRCKLARSYHALNRHEDALTAFRTVLAHDPDYADAHIGLGQCHFETGRIEEALSEHRAASHISTKNPNLLMWMGNEYMLLGRWELASEMYERILVMRQDFPSAWRKLGMAHARLGDYKAAVNACKTAVMQDEASAQARSSLGMVLYGAGEFYDAIASHQKALELDPHSPRMRYELARTYMAAGKLKQAVATYEETLRIQPGNILAEIELGVALKHLGNYEQAFAAFAVAERIDPANTLNYCRWAQTHFEAHQFKESVVRFARAVEIDSDSFMAHFGMGHAFMELKQFKKASEAFEEAVRIEPKNALAFTSLGIAYESFDQHQAAVSACSTAVHLDPTLPTAHCTRGKAFWHLRRNNEALACLKQALALDPGMEDAHYWLGRTYVSLGNRKAVAKEYRYLKDKGSPYADQLRIFVRE